MSDAPKLSLYFYLFNARLRDFDLDGCVHNFTQFFDQTVCATVPSDDDTLDRLLAYERELGADRFKVIQTTIDYRRNNRFDGDLKTAALEACVHPIRVIADADELFPLSNRPMWNAAAESLLSNPFTDGYLIPVIDVYSDMSLIRADQQVGVKFRLHKASVVRRGVPRFAEMGGGLFNTKASDSTEPLLANGELAQFMPLAPRPYLQPNLVYMLVASPYVVHLGFLDLERKAKLGKEFWKEHWEKRSGATEDVATERYQLDGHPLIKHGLPLT